MQTIIVDMTPGFRMPTIYYSQGDVGTQFAIDLRSRFGDSFPTGTTVTIQATKPSGFGFSVAATSVTNGVATFTTTAEMTDEFGRFPAELKVTKTGLTLFTANFYMDGERNTHPEGTTDGSQETVIPELTQLVERVEDAASSVLDMTVVANTLPAGSDATYSYDEETNTATFGIPKGADGSLASGVLAPTYSSSSTYAVGDYVYYSGSLYRCTTAITTAEAWTSGHWTQVALAPEVSDLKSDLAEVADKKEIIRSAVWHNGYFDTTTQTIVSNGTFATCEAISGFDGYVYIPSGKIFKLFAYYNGSYKTRTKSNTWLTGGVTVQIPKGTRFIISVRNTDTSTNVDLSTLGVVITKRLSTLSAEFNHKEYVNGWVNGKYISANSTSISPTTHANYAYIPITVSRGDMFIISATFSGTNVVGLCLMKDDFISDFYDSSLTTPKFDSELYVCKTDGTLYVCGLIAQDLSVWKLTNVDARTVIDCYGDSLTSGAGDSNIGYPPKLQTLLGSNYTVNQYGSGGDGVNTIACRMGALQMVVPPITIPASGASASFQLKDFEGIKVKPFNDGGTHRPYNWSKCPINPCVIDGIAGNIAINADDEEYTFTRIDAGNAKSVTRPTIALTPQIINENENICILWGGTNNTWQGIDFIDRYIGYMVEKCKSGRYIVLGLTAKNVFSNIETMNTKMKQAFGVHFLDIRQYILDYGLSDAGITPTSADTTAIANGEMPPSLLADATHFNSAGYTVIAKQVYIKGKSLGYWD